MRNSVKAGVLVAWLMMIPDNRHLKDIYAASAALYIQRHHTEFTIHNRDYDSEWAKQIASKLPTQRLCFGLTQFIFGQSCVSGCSSR